MTTSVVPCDILDSYEIHEWRHAWAILATDFPDEFSDLITTLREFRLLSSQIIVGGGNKGPIAKALDGRLSQLDWSVKNFDTQVLLDGKAIDSPTHEIDCFKGKVALEIEWNNKDPFFDRDLNNFRLLFELRAISVGIIITRCTHLHESTFRTLPKPVRGKYGASSTHMGKLLPKLYGGGGGGCPIIAIGIGLGRWVEDISPADAPDVYRAATEIKKFNKGKRPADRSIPEKLRFVGKIDMASLVGLEDDETES